jgi:hypothetical protein
MPRSAQLHPTPLAVNLVEAIIIPIAAAGMGIFVKWATSRDRPRRWKREYANIGFELILAAFLFCLSLSFKAWAEQAEVDKATRISLVQLINLEPSTVTPRLEDPDLGGGRVFCKNLALGELGTRKEVGRFSKNDLAVFLKKELTSAQDPDRRVRVATCQSFLSANDRADRRLRRMVAGSILAVLILVVTWPLSVIVEEHGYEPSPAGSGVAGDRLNIRVGILLPVAVGLLFLLMIPFVVGR